VIVDSARVGEVEVNDVALDAKAWKAERARVVDQFSREERINRKVIGRYMMLAIDRLELDRHGTKARRIVAAASCFAHRSMPSFCTIAMTHAAALIIPLEARLIERPRARAAD
jgi:hypothetical protein